MLVLEYNARHGLPVADGEAEAKVLEWYQEERTNQVFSTENIIYAARVLVIRGAIPHTHICFKFDGQEIHINDIGKLSAWPSGFGDYFDRWLQEVCLV